MADFNVALVDDLYDSALVNAFADAFSDYTIPIAVTAEQWPAFLSGQAVDQQLSRVAKINGTIASFLLVTKDVANRRWRIAALGSTATAAEAHRGAQVAERVRNAQEEVALSQTRYANGLTSYLPVLTARTTLIEARRDQAESTARSHSALASLYKVLGEKDLSSVGAATIRP